MTKPTITLSVILLSANSVCAQENLKSAAENTQQVLIQSQTSAQDGLDFVAGKIVINRKQIEDSGVQNVAEILKREPAITVGKDGSISLLGLVGYTQILQDGRTPFSKSPLELDLSQVEKIEIIKTSTAATGPFGIAGTINIVSRKVAAKSQQQLRIGSSAIGGDYGVNGSWNLNQATAGHPFSFNLNSNASQNNTPSHSSNMQRQILPQELVQFQAQKDSSRRDELISLSANLNYKFSPALSLSARPDAGQFTTLSQKQETRLWADGRVQQITHYHKARFSAPGLQLSASYDSDYGKFEGQLRLRHSNTQTNAERNERIGHASGSYRQQQQHDRGQNYELSLDYSHSLNKQHELSMVLRLQYNSQQSRSAYWLDYAPDRFLTQFNRDSDNQQKRYRWHLQDEWRIDKSWSMNAGVAVEQSDLRLTETTSPLQRNQQLWSPSLHLAKKFEAPFKRRLRWSLARSFKEVEIDQLKSQVDINPLAPCNSLNLCTQNSADTADRSGNPALRAETALAMNLQYEHGLAAASQLSLEWYSRRLRNKIGQELVLMPVAWSAQARYLERPANLGEATLYGVNFDWRLAARDFWPTAAKLDLRGSLGWAHSQIANLPGPDNRLEGSSPWRAKLGLSYSLADWPIKLDLDASYLPADWLQLNLSERRYQARKTSLTANAVWNVNPATRLVLNLDNLLPQTAGNLYEYRSQQGLLQNATELASLRRLALRLEMKL